MTCILLSIEIDKMIKAVYLTKSKAMITKFLWLILATKYYKVTYLCRIEEPEGMESDMWTTY